MTRLTADPALQAFPADLREAYTPSESLGTGAAGTVYRALDRSLDREVAIKVCFGVSNQEARERFLREARSLARVEHPHVLRLLSHGVTAAGYPYLVTELLEGTSLDHPGAADDPLEAMLPIAEALEAVHAAGMVHRDLKPANIVLTQEGRPVLVDFGIVQDPTRTALTRSGQVIGTLAYMAPERLEGGVATPASDWYAWGVCLHQLVHGDLPYSTEELVAVVQGSSLRGPRARGTGPIRELLHRALSTDPAERPASRAAIEAVLEGRCASDTGAAPAVPGAPRGPRRAGWRAAVALAVLGLAVALSRGPGPWTGLPSAPPAASASPTTEAVRKQLLQECRAQIRTFFGGLSTRFEKDGDAELFRVVRDPRLPLRLRRLLDGIEDRVRTGNLIPGPGSASRALGLRLAFELEPVLAMFRRARFLTENPYSLGEENRQADRLAVELLALRENLDACDRVVWDFLARSRAADWGGPIPHMHLAITVANQVRLESLDSYLRPGLQALASATDGDEILTAGGRILSILGAGSSSGVLGCARRLEVFRELDGITGPVLERVPAKQAARYTWSGFHVTGALYEGCRDQPGAERLLLVALTGLEALERNFEELMATTWARGDAQQKLARMQAALVLSAAPTSLSRDLMTRLGALRQRLESRPEEASP